MTLKQKQEGFTIVELLIVIIVLGIAAALIVTSVTDYQQNKRNQERQRDIRSLQTGIENYYAQNGTYPSLEQLNDTSWRLKNLKSLQTNDYKDPRATSDKLAAAPAETIYSYAVTANDGNACDNKTKDCTKYTLTATYEGGDTFVKNDLN